MDEMPYCRLAIADLFQNLTAALFTNYFYIITGKNKPQ